MSINDKPTRYECPSGLLTPEELSENLVELGKQRTYIESYCSPFCEDSTKYEKVAKIGQGTFG